MSRVVRTLFVSIFSIAIAIPAVSAQQSQDTGAPPAPQKLNKETKRKMRKSLKELDSAYKQWLTEDVTYIISPDERNAFLQLDTNEEREPVYRAVSGCGAAATLTYQRTILKKSISSHCLRQRTFCFGHSGMENRSRPHVYHVGPGGRGRIAPHRWHLRSADGRRRRLHLDLSVGNMALALPGRHRREHYFGIRRSRGSGESHLTTGSIGKKTRCCTCRALD